MLFFALGRDVGDATLLKDTLSGIDDVYRNIRTCNRNEQKATCLHRIAESFTGTIGSYMNYNGYIEQCKDCVGML